VIADALKVAVCVFALAVLQVSMGPQITDAPGGPDLLVVLVVAVALLRGVEWAAATGFAGGLLVDAMLFEPLGATSLLLVLTALGTARVAAALDRATVARAFALVLLATPVVQVGHAVLAATLEAGYPVSYVLRDAVVPTTVQTAVLALPLLAGLFRLFGQPSRVTADVPPVVPA
jgi:rod shape-determining protein MreD